MSKSGAVIYLLSGQKKKRNKNPMEEKILELEKQIETLSESLETETAAKMRALADLQNFQRRSTEQQALWSAMAVKDFLQKFLPNLLELSLGAEHSSDEDMKKVVSKFAETLAKQGVEKIEPAAGDNIDPDLHEVLMVEAGEAGKVVRLLEPGWKFQNSVIQPAKISGAVS
ncbi:nucleotide exchange factor GrpE [Candidatus Gracilibacteria bacterium]|nr:nucleotide exchange factor GrpE [Candidatus Gracilibacteria bacterium]